MTREDVFDGNRDLLDTAVIDMLTNEVLDGSSARHPISNHLTPRVPTD